MAFSGPSRVQVHAFMGQKPWAQLKPHSPARLPSPEPETQAGGRDGETVGVVSGTSTVPQEFSGQYPRLRSNSYSPAVTSVFALNRISDDARGVGLLVPDAHFHASAGSQTAISVSAGEPTLTGKVIRAGTVHADLLREKKIRPRRHGLARRRTSNPGVPILNSRLIGRRDGLALNSRRNNIITHQRHGNRIPIDASGYISVVHTAPSSGASDHTTIWDQSPIETMTPGNEPSTVEKKIRFWAISAGGNSICSCGRSVAARTAAVTGSAGCEPT
ncbi:hypothetical protein BDW71DRAFT_207108 [Aspergillus fruticulosus]